MSVVVALRDKEDGNFVLTSDSQVTYGNCKYHGLKKVFKYKTLNLTVGSVGDLRIMNLLFNNEELFKPLIKNDKIDRDYLTKNFTKKLFEYFKEYINDCVQKSDSGTERSITCNVDIIIAYKNEAFHIFNDYSILEIQDYDAIGIGIEATTSCLEALNRYSNLGAFDIATEAIKIVSKNIIGIDSTVTLIKC